MTLVKFKNDKGTALTPGVNDIFESIFNDTFFSNPMVSRAPAVNISETDDYFHIELAAPGLKKQDFIISLERDQLSISVEKESESEKNDRSYIKHEYSYTSFVRSFTLPEQADQDKIEASYEGGLLKIDVAKKEEAKAVSRRIELK